MSQPLLVQALHRRPLARPPLWLMRQAGRYLPEYRAVRARFADFITFCLTPEAAAEVTLQPVTRFDLDAAIIFADILTVPHALGHTVTFTEGQGPRVRPLTTPAEVAALAARLPEVAETLAPVAQTVRLTRAALGPDQAVIGFCGAPFTLACYILDPKPAQGIPNTLAFAATHPQAFAGLIETLTAASVAYLGAQVRAGADALQLFDSWALLCPPELWRAAVEAPLLAIATGVRAVWPGTPVIAFPRGAAPGRLVALHQANAAAGNPLAAVSLSTEVDMAWAAATLQPHLAVQGNLDPALLAGAAAPLRQAAARLLDCAAPRPGYVFNLGHGLTPATVADNVLRLAEQVRAWQTPAA